MLNQAIIILDDDELIHAAWKERFKKENISSPLISFYKSEDLAAWHKQNKNECPVYLIDYELIGSEETGLEIIQKLNLKNQIYLVSSRCNEQLIREHCQQLEVLIVPKSFAPYIKIEMLKNDMDQMI